MDEYVEYTLAYLSTIFQCSLAFYTDEKTIRKKLLGDKTEAIWTSKQEAVSKELASLFGEIK